jgi:hypothetical protein
MGYASAEQITGGQFRKILKGKVRIAYFVRWERSIQIA